MNNYSPIPSPPPDLVQRWEDRIFDKEENVDVLLIEAYKAGADQELEACCETLDMVNCSNYWSQVLRSGRRPKPQTLNSVALQMLGTIEQSEHFIPEITDTIRRALEALDD